MGSFGCDRLAYEIHALDAAEGDSLLAAGRTDAFDTPELLKKHDIAEIDVRVVYTGAAAFSGPADLAIEPGADLRLSLGGALIVDTATDPRRLTFTPEFDAPLALEVEVLSPAADRARRTDIEIEGGPDAGDFFDIVRAPSEKTLVATVTLDGVLAGVFAFEEAEALNAFLVALAAEGRAVEATVEGSLRVETPGSYVFRGTDIDVFRVGDVVDRTGFFDAVAPLGVGRNPFAFEVSLAPGATTGFGLRLTGPDTGGETISITGRRSALTDGLLEIGDDLIALYNDIEAEVGDFLEVASSFAVFQPTFDVQLGLDTRFGWDIDIDGLGRTATEQPVEFVFHAPERVTPGGSVILNVTDMRLSAPTTRSGGLEISAIDLTAEFALPETQISNIGVELSTKNPSDDVLQALFGNNPLTGLADAFDEFASLRLQLDATFDLDDAFAVANELAAAFGVSGKVTDLLDIGGFFRGLFSGAVDPAETFTGIAAAVKAKDFAGVVDIILGIIAAGQAIAPDAEPPVLVTLEDVQGRQIGFDGASFVPIVTEAALIGPGADRFVTTEVAGLGEVRLPVAAVQAAAETSGVNDLFASLREAFSEGIEPVEGLKIAADLPLNTFFEHTGFGFDDDPFRGAASPIIATSEVDLLSIDVDVEKVVREAIIKVVDQAISTPGLPPKVLAVLVASRVALALQPLYVDTLQQGASAELELNPAPLISATLDAVSGLFGSATEGINNLFGTSIPVPDFDAVDFAELMQDRDALAGVLDQVLSPVTDALEAAPEFIIGLLEDAGEGIGELLVGGAALLEGGITQAVSGLQGSLQSISDGVSSLAGLVQSIDGQFDAIKNDADQVLGLIGQAADSIDVASFFAGQVASATSGVGSAVDSIKGTINGFINPVVSDFFIGGAAKGILGGLGVAFSGNNVNFNAGIFAPVFNAIDQAINSVASFIGSTGSAVLGALDPLNAVSSIVNAINAAFSSGVGLAQDVLDGLLAAGTAVSAAFFSVNQALDQVSAAATDLREGAEDVDEFLSQGIDLSFEDIFDGAKDFFVNTLADASQGIKLSGDIDFNFEDLAYAFDLKLKQTTIFNPEAVKVEYFFGDQRAVVDYGQAVRFDVPGDISASPEVRARLLFDGAYDYIYTLEPQHDLDYQLLGFSLFGELTLGERDPVALENPFDPGAGTFDYALLKLTEDYDPSRPETLTDEALIEIPANLVIEAVQGVLIDVFLNRTRDLFDAGLNIEPIEFVPFGEIGLFRIRDVPAAETGGLAFAPVVASAEVVVERVVTQGRNTDEELGGGPRNDVIEAGGGDDTVDGEDGNDRLDGGRGEDTLNGGRGRDVLEGGADDDVLRGGAGADRLFGEGGDDLIFGGNGRDALFGGSGDDDLRGGRGRDALRGEAGDDRLEGEAGNDDLWGGSGADVIVIGRRTGRDVMHDFEDGVDKIRIESGASRFAQLDIERDGGDATVSIRGATLRLSDVRPADLDASDFIFG